MTVESDSGNDTDTSLTVQILGAGILVRALEALLAPVSDIVIATDDADVILLVGAEGQTQIRHGRPAGKRRRREHFALLTNAQDIDYRLVREAPIEVFVGTDESLPTLVQGLVAASRTEAFCSQQLVPALIAAAVNSASNAERAPTHAPSPEPRRAPADRFTRKQSPLPRSLSGELEPGHSDEPASENLDVSEQQDIEENLVSQEVRTLHLAIALGLSEREAEVAIEAVKGFSNTEIAELLTMSVPTIKYHLYQAYQKLGIHRRSQLAAALFLPAAE